MGKSESRGTSPRLFFHVIRAKAKLYHALLKLSLALKVASEQDRMLELQPSSYQETVLRAILERPLSFIQSLREESPSPANIRGQSYTSCSTCFFVAQA